MKYVSSKLSIPEDKAELYPFVEVSTSEVKKESFLITVLLPEQGPERTVTAEIIWNDTEQNYQIKIKNDTRTAECFVYDTAEVPEFKVE